MLKTLIALAAASTAFALAASFYARVPTVQTGAEVGPNGVFAVTPSDALTSSVTDADGHVISSGVTDRVSIRFGENLTQIRNSLNPQDDGDYIAYRHVFAQIYFEAHDKRNRIKPSTRRSNSIKGQFP